MKKDGIWNAYWRLDGISIAEDGRERTFQAKQKEYNYKVEKHYVHSAHI